MRGTPLHKRQLLAGAISPARDGKCKRRAGSWHVPATDPVWIRCSANHSAVQTYYPSGVPQGSQSHPTRLPRPPRAQLDLVHVSLNGLGVATAGLGEGRQRNSTHSTMLRAGTCAPSTVLHSCLRPELVLSTLHPAKGSCCSKRECNRQE